MDGKNIEKDFQLEKLLAAAASRMRLDLHEGLIGHPGELGTDREEVVRNFLSANLPKRFDISTGFVFDSTGRVSKQLDIIISDSSVASHFNAAGGTRYYPCESVVAVGQVKSSLTSQQVFLDALANLESVKRLDRSAEGCSIDLKFDEAIDQKANHLHQIFTFLIVTGKAISGVSAQEVLLNHIVKQEANIWLNVLLAFDQYLITYCCDNGICPNPMDARGIALQEAKNSPELLMRFVLLLGQAIEVTRTSSLPYRKYLSTVKDWTAKVIYSTKDDPPPYLSSLS